MGGMMGAGLFFAMGGILFMLGLISLQLGTMRQNGWAASAFIVLAFVCCLLLAGYLGMLGLMAMSLSGL